MLAATLAELGASGYAALSIDAVAQRAGVHKTTVYRRWKTREALVVDAVSEQTALAIPIPDTGAVETDLQVLAHGFVRWATGAEGQIVLAALFSDAARIPEVAAARGQIFLDRIRRATPAIERAIERRELPAGTDPVELVKALVAPLYLRLLITNEPLDLHAADRAADAALLAARSGLFAPNSQ